MSELADLLERFRRGAELVAVATTGAAGPVLDFRPAEGKWGVRTIVCHLADTEIVLSMRLRQVLAESNPILPAIEQDAWAERLDYGKRKLSQALDTFRRTRAENYELLKDLPEEAFARTGQRDGDGSRDRHEGYAQPERVEQTRQQCAHMDRLAVGNVVGAAVAGDIGIDAVGDRGGDIVDMGDID